MLTALLPIIGPAVDKLLNLIPDKNAQIKHRAEIEKTILEAANAAALAQIKVNEVEAQHSSIFVAGWRPFIGWVCGAGLAWAFVGHPLFAWIVALTGADITPPTLQTEAMISLVMAMLGMAGWRSLDKIQGVARTKIGGGK